MTLRNTQRSLRRSQSRGPRRLGAGRKRGSRGPSPLPRRPSFRTRSPWPRHGSAWPGRVEASTVSRDMTGRDRALGITGGAQLDGRICVSGSKNAALPEMAAALLTTERVTLHNVPRVSDTRLMAEMIRDLGGQAHGEATTRPPTAPARRTALPHHLA